MKNFKRIINEIYPNPLVGFLFITLVTSIAEVVIYIQSSGIHYLQVIVFFVWQYVLFNFIVVFSIRRKIFKKYNSSRGELIDYLEYRFRIEKAKSTKRRPNPKKIATHEKLKEVITIVKRKRYTR